MAWGLVETIRPIRRLRVLLYNTERTHLKIRYWGDLPDYRSPMDKIWCASMSIKGCNFRLSGWINKKSTVCPRPLTSQWQTAPVPKECEPISDVHNMYIGIIGFYFRKIKVVHSFSRQTAPTSKGRLMNMWQWAKCISAKLYYCKRRILRLEKRRDNLADRPVNPKECEKRDWY